MAKILLAEIEELKRNFVSMGTLVEEALKRTLKALETRDARLAREIIANDDAIDQLEVNLEEECLKILALHQPVAGDLRFIIAIMKINNDLERIGDLAVNTCKRIVPLAEYGLNPIPINLKGIAKRTQEMLKKSLDAMINYDSKLAYEVCTSDDEIDAINRMLFSQLMEEIKKNPDNLEICINCVSISKNLERIADYSTNIAEDVIYLVEGEIIRHRPEVFREKLLEKR